MWGDLGAKTGLWAHQRISHLAISTPLVLAGRRCNGFGPVLAQNIHDRYNIYVQIQYHGRSIAHERVNSEPTVYPVFVLNEMNRKLISSYY